MSQLRFLGFVVSRRRARPYLFIVRPDSNWFGRAGSPWTKDDEHKLFVVQANNEDHARSLVAEFVGGYKRDDFSLGHAPMPSVEHPWLSNVYTRANIVWQNAELGVLVAQEGGFGVFKS